MIDRHQTHWRKRAITMIRAMERDDVERVGEICWACMSRTPARGVSTSVTASGPSAPRVPLHGLSGADHGLGK